MATLTPLGLLSVGACLPFPTAALATAYADLQARVAALAQFTPQPVSFTAQLDLILKMQAGIEAMITLGITPPSISLQITLVLALVASLEAELQIILALQLNLGAFGVFAYAYAGRADDMGGTLTTALAAGFPGGSPADATNALILATTVPACWAAMQGVFKTTP